MRLKPLWRRTLDGQPVQDAVACLHEETPGTFVVMNHYPHYKGRKREIGLVGLDPSTGGIQWSVPFPAGVTRGEAAACVVANTVVVLFTRGAVRAYDRTSGALVGETDAPAAAGQVSVVGVDHSAVTLGGPGVAVQVDASPGLDSGSTIRLGDAYLSIARLGTGALLGGGRGVAVVQDGGRRVHSIEVPSGRTLWSVPVDEVLDTALVRMNYILLGGARLHVLDRRSGRTLGTPLTLEGRVRRIDERSWWMYVLHGTSQLTVFHLDTRERLGGCNGARAFDYTPGDDITLDEQGQLTAIRPGTCQPHHVAVLAEVPLESPQSRLRLEGDHVHVVEHRPGSPFAIACYGLHR